jgi:hypothetical protein
MGGVELGGNSMGKLRAKAYDNNNDGILVIGFDQNIIIKYYINEDKVKKYNIHPFRENC